VSKLLFWIFAVPLAILIIVFSVNNRTDVVLDLWPLDMVTAPVPVFSVALTSLLAGFLIGGIIAWLSGGAARKRARRMTRRAEAAERLLVEAEQRIQALEEEAGDESGEVRRLPGNAA
jgi:uncharacterized integral membrane protein